MVSAAFIADAVDHGFGFIQFKSLAVRQMILKQSGKLVIHVEDLSTFTAGDMDLITAGLTVHITVTGLPAVFLDRFADLSLFTQGRKISVYGTDTDIGTG